nr:hypothetical protein [Candidatus Sigynarchaeum springense]
MESIDKLTREPDLVILGKDERLFVPSSRGFAGLTVFFIVSTAVIVAYLNFILSIAVLAVGLACFGIVHATKTRKPGTRKELGIDAENGVAWVREVKKRRVAALRAYPLADIVDVRIDALARKGVVQDQSVCIREWAAYLILGEHHEELLFSRLFKYSWKLLIKEGPETEKPLGNLGVSMQIPKNKREEKKRAAGEAVASEITALITGFMERVAAGMREPVQVATRINEDAFKAVHSELKRGRWDQINRKNRTTRHAYLVLFIMDFLNAVVAIGPIEVINRLVDPLYDFKPPFDYVGFWSVWLVLMPSIFVLVFVLTAKSFYSQIYEVPRGDIELAAMPLEEYKVLVKQVEGRRLEVAQTYAQEIGRKQYGTIRFGHYLILGLVAFFAIAAILLVILRAEWAGVYLAVFVNSMLLGFYGLFMQRDIKGKRLHPFVIDATTGMVDDLRYSSKGKETYHEAIPVSSIHRVRLDISTYDLTLDGNRTRYHWWGIYLFTTKYELPYLLFVKNANTGIVDPGEIAVIGDRVLEVYQAMKALIERMNDHVEFEVNTNKSRMVQSMGGVANMAPTSHMCMGALVMLGIVIACSMFLVIVVTIVEGKYAVEAGFYIAAIVGLVLVVALLPTFLKQRYFKIW